MPDPASALVGRTVERAALIESLRSGARLVTLTGPGGMGKSSLALDVGWEVESGYPGGAWFVPLASLRYPALVASAIASTLGIREPDAGVIENAIVQHLSTDKALVILDNFEHLMDAGSLVETLLEACPGLQLMITSRIPLRLQDERVFEIGPLAVPDLEQLPECERLAEIESVQLFTIRARESYHRFAFTPECAPAVAAICVRLGGLPLAIELVAARCRHASPQTLLRQLDVTLPVLTGGGEELPERQRTMRETIAWSFQLLDEPHQRLFARVAVHAGGFDLEAAIAVVQAKPAIAIDVFDGISQLLDHGLLTRIDGAGGTTRYGMLEPVREFALEQMEASGDLATIRMAHARHFLALAESMRRRLQGPESVAALAWFEREHANLRGAIGVLIRARRAYLARSLVAALWQFWWIRRHLLEGQRWLDAVIELFDPANPDELEPELRFAAALLALARNDGRRARQHATTGVTLARQLGAEFWQAALLAVLGQVAQRDGDAQHALHLYRLVLKTIPQLRGAHSLARYLEGAVHLSASTVYFSGGDVADAEYHANEGLRAFLRLGDKWGIGLAKLQLAAIANAAGNVSQALELYLDSVPLLWEIGDVAATAQGLIGLAEIAASLGLAETAATLLGAARAMQAEGALPGAQVIARDPAAIMTRLQELTTATAIETAMAAGKERAKKDLIALVEEAIAAILAKLSPPKRGAGKTGPDSLSRREREVLCLMVEGMADRQIADALFVGYRTVTTHAEHIYGKLNVNSRAAAVAYAIRHELC